MIYAGGAVDYSNGAGHAWRHALGVSVFCPICENVGLHDAELIMVNNTRALLSCDAAVFLLDGTFTVGTPVEIHNRLGARGPESMLIIHPGRTGVFVRYWASLGVEIVSSFDEARVWAKNCGRSVK